MYKHLPLTFLLVVGVAVSIEGKKSSASSVVPPPPQAGYSQPIVGNNHAGGYGAPPNAPYSPYMGAASTQTEYYQPMDSSQGGGYQAPYQGYARTAAPTSSAGGYYEPIPQPSGHYHHPIKRGHYGGGHELGFNFLIIPLIIIPLLLCWPWFLYAASHHHHPIVYAAPGWKRSSDGKAPVVKEKVDELTEKVVSKLSNKVE